MHPLYLLMLLAFAAAGVWLGWQLFHPRCPECRAPLYWGAKRCHRCRAEIERPERPKRKRSPWNPKVSDSTAIIAIVAVVLLLFFIRWLAS